MSSESYKKFLELQAKKNPIQKERTRFLYWEEKERSPPSGSSSNMLESIYLGREPEETVVMDHRTATVLQERLVGLEGEVDRMHRRIRIMKVLIAALLGATLFTLWIMFWGWEGLFWVFGRK